MDFLEELEVYIQMNFKVSQKKDAHFAGSSARKLIIRYVSVLLLGEL